MASAARKTAVSDRLFERIAQFADRMSGYRLGDYAATSGYVRQSASPFGGFGAIVASGSRPLPLGHSIKEAAIFTVEEAKDRLVAFIDGRYVPGSLADLIEYLGERFMRLETRILPGGRVANYLVDTRTSQSVAAAQVDPKLGHAALLAAHLRASLRREIGRSEPAEAFHSWQGMMLVLDNAASGNGYTVSAGTAWFGKIHAVASSDHGKNLAIVREARARGIDLVLPTRQEGPVSELVAGMPILVRSRSMKAADVHPGLAHQKLSLAFGKGMAETFDGLGQRSRLAGDMGREDKVVSMEAFRRKFIRTNREQEEAADNSLGFGGVGGEHGTRDLVIRRTTGEELQFYVFDRDFFEEVPIAPGALPPGRYVRETVDGTPEGYTEVGQGGALRHYDSEGHAVNLRRLPASEKNAKGSPLPVYGRS